ncbi:hypothetical protein BGW39_008796 [Mortierella sp. 14UC]|nr:hypothetical protein BGW39_008796 [Mortierella sp. 14UC]
MLPRTILAVASTLAFASSVHGATIPAAPQVELAKRDMSSLWLVQAEAQAMVPLKRHNNVPKPPTVMKRHQDCDDEDGEEDEGRHHGHGHHGNGQEQHRDSDHHADNGQGANDRQGEITPHDESGTLTGAYTVTLVPATTTPTGTTTAGQPDMNGKPSAAVNTRSGAGFALISLLVAVFFL